MAKPRTGEQMVPAEPFSAYLRETHATYKEQHKTILQSSNAQKNDLLGPSERLAVELGWEGKTGVRMLWRYRTQVVERTADSKRVKWTETAQEWVRSTVEDACHNIHPDLFYELYPEYQHERDITLEPDAYCPFCEEWVTPVDGLCPWCVCEHGHLFREVGVTDDGFACLECARLEHNARARESSKLKRERQKEAA